MREGPYSHLNPADIQEAVFLLEAESSAASSVADGSSTTSLTQSVTNPWIPYKIILSPDGNEDEVITDNIKLIAKKRLKGAKRTYLDEWASEAYLAVHEGRRPVALPVEGSMEQLRYLPMAPTKLNKELVRILIQMLNDQLGDRKTQTSDNLVLGVVQMVADSWYWGATKDLKAHFEGLREMIRLRGGLSQLGLHGYLAKMIIVLLRVQELTQNSHDIVMALAHEINPSMYGHRGFEFRDPFEVPFRTALNSPLISGWQSFDGCSTSLQLHPTTANILDDMRDLFDAVLTLPLYPTLDDVQKIMKIASLFYDRLSHLPENTPSQRSTKSSTSSRSGSVESSSKSPESAGTSCSSQTTDLPDMVYRVVRKVALIWCQAIFNRSPISNFCSEQEIMLIWGSVWRSGLPMWKSVLGVFAWVMIAIASNCHKTGPGRLIKTLTVSTMMSIAVENWHIAIRISETALKIQRYLTGGRDGSDGKDLMGGEKVVDKYGFAMEDVLPNLDLSADGE
ncbi:hypothetical protein FSARC_3499 [Fusarium sarcochroum]|uniref:Uncharacterized protein n=1 Tax=Fusarium sarcochroum TaxID=1208366 RepID=A0A8H4U3N2_9HYPO|nr:hypothetical protein FSARC_3499 [Fusarium sarcochroum]